MSMTDNGTPSALRPDLFVLADPTARAFPVQLKTLDGREAFVRRLSVGGRQSLVAITGDTTRPALERMVDLLRLIVCDKSGDPLFPVGDDRVWDLPSDVGDELIDLALEKNGLTIKAQAEKKST